MVKVSRKHWTEKLNKKNNMNLKNSFIFVFKVTLIGRDLDIFKETHIPLEKCPGPPRYHSCQKSVHGGNLTRRGPSSRLHQWHRSMWLSFLHGSSHSPNQSEQAMLYLMIIPASVPISHVCERPANIRRNDSQEPSERDPAQQLNSGSHWAISSHFTQIQKNHGKC